MSQFFKALCFGIAVYAALQLSGRDSPFEKNIAATLAPGNEVVMYSLTTCPYCREKRQWMTRVGIPFREYFIDSDQARMDELGGLLAARGVPPGGVGTPTLVVNGELLINNPAREEVRRRLKYRG